MRLWLISQDTNSGYDTYDSAVVAAPSEEAARRISPSAYYEWSDGHGGWCFVYADGTRRRDQQSGWANHLDQIAVKLLGDATLDIEQGVICASFNAG